MVLKNFINTYMGVIFCCSDHKPLLTIFGEKKGIPAMAASRLQRWAIILAAYSYTIEYVPTKEHGNADCLSRLPVENDSVFEQYHSQNSIVNMVQESRITSLPISAEEIQKATDKDPVLQKVIETMKKGWPKLRRKVSKELQPYFDRRFQLSLQRGCILCGQRVIIPTLLREQVLIEIHEGHTGIVRMKAVARMHVWWPNIDHEIESCVHECDDCQRNSRNPVKAPVHPWEQPAKPWKRLHIDFAGPFCGSMWLILVDAQSKWPEVIQMKSTTANKMVEILRSLFSRFGLPHQLVSDNGPQFISDEYKHFCEQNGIRRTLVAPYHPSSNGEAERFVQTFKAAMRKAEQKELQLALTQFLLRYRTTPHPVTGKSPAELIFGRQIRTRLDLLHPSDKEKTRKTQEVKGKEIPRKLEVGDLVWMRSYGGKEKWIPGTVVSKSGPLSYTISASGQKSKRHIDQLKKRVRKGHDSDETCDDFMQVSSGRAALERAPVEPDHSTPEESLHESGQTDTEFRDKAIEMRRYQLRQNRHPPERFGQ